jgi:hypothetical protein
MTDEERLKELSDQVGSHLDCNCWQCWLLDQVEKRDAIHKAEIAGYARLLDDKDARIAELQRPYRITIAGQEWEIIPGAGSARRIR